MFTIILKTLRAKDWIKTLYDLMNYNIIYAYGNGSGDIEMLKISDKKFYRQF